MSVVKVYAVKSDNTADTASTAVSVVNDGTGNRQVVALGMGDGTANLIDSNHPLPISLPAATVAALTPYSAVSIVGTVPVSATALPLPAGAATSAAQTTGNNSLATLVTNSPSLGQALAAASVPVVLTASQLATLTPLTTVGISGTAAISAAALPLPAGAATSALQGTGNTSVGSIDTKTPALGQALAAASVPVVLTAAQLVTLTPPTTVTTTPPSNATTNITQFGGTNLATGAGVSGAGVPRVTVASDSSIIVAPGTNTMGAVSQAPTTPGTTTMQSAAGATGNGTAQTVTGYAQALLNVTGTFVGTIVFEGSPDGGTTYVPVLAQIVGSTASPSNSTSTTGLFLISTEGLSNLRARISAWTSGSITVVSYASVYTSASQIAATNLATKLAGEDLTNDLLKVNQVFSSTYISTATTTTLKTGAGLLHTLVVNGGTTGTIIVYDNTAGSGTILASFDTTNALAAFLFDCSFSTGLTIVTSAATKITATWR